jgi:hypothetical protein
MENACTGPMLNGAVAGDFLETSIGDSLWLEDLVEESNEKSIVNRDYETFQPSQHNSDTGEAEVDLWFSNMQRHKSSASEQTMERAGNFHNSNSSDFILKYGQTQEAQAITRAVIFSQVYKSQENNIENGQVQPFASDLNTGIRSRVID